MAQKKALIKGTHLLLEEVEYLNLDQRLMVEALLVADDLHRANAPATLVVRAFQHLQRNACHTA